MRHKNKHIKLSEEESFEDKWDVQRLRKYLQSTDTYDTKVLKFTRGSNDILFLYTPYRFHRECEIRTNPSQALLGQDFEWICDLMQSKPRKYVFDKNSAPHISVHVNETSYDTHFEDFLSHLHDRSYVYMEA